MTKTRLRSLFGGAATLSLLIAPIAAHADGRGTPGGSSDSQISADGRPTYKPTPPQPAHTQPAQPRVPKTAAPNPGAPAASATAAPSPNAPAAPRSNAPAEANGTVTLDLYNLTDVHGHIEKASKNGAVTESGVSAVGCYLDRARSASGDSSFTLLGDNIGASPFTSGSLQDNPTIAALNELKPVASTIGNHELDLGVDVFKHRIDGTGGYTKVGFPYLGANVDGMGRYLGDKVIWTSASGVRVAFIGAIAGDVPYKLSPGATAGLTFNDPIPKINTMAKELKDSGQADVVIAMLDDDVKNNYPKMGPSVDGIMGGDTHVPYKFSMVDGARGNKLSAIASGSYTDNLGNLQITYDKAAKKVVRSEAKLIPASEVAQCGEKQSIKQIVDKAVEDSKAAGDKVVATGYGFAFSRGVFSSNGETPDPGSNRGIESSLGDLAADSLQGTVTTKEGKPVDIGAINAGGLRADLVPSANGDITYRQTFAVQPFSNQLGYVTITGADFKKALEQQWKTNLNTQNSRPMLKLGLSRNVKYTFDPAKPYGNRITSVTVNGKPLDLKRKYTVGSVTFLLSGGDSFDALTAGGAPVITDNLDRDKFNSYLAANPGLKPRAAKSSIGVTLPSEPVKDGQTIDVSLRGLSFSEGPSVTKNVKVNVGEASTTSPVDNSLADPDANNEKATITADGAGRAVAKVKVDGKCAANPGKQIKLPVTVRTDFAEVVGAEQGLTVTVACGGSAQPTASPSSAAPGAPSTPPSTAAPGAPSTSPSGTAAPTATGSAKPTPSGNPSDGGKPSASSKPSSTSAPSATAKPSGTVKPSGTAKPGGPTASPSATVKPSATAEAPRPSGNASPSSALPSAVDPGGNGPSDGNRPGDDLRPSSTGDPGPAKGNARKRGEGSVPHASAANHNADGPDADVKAKSTASKRNLHTPGLAYTGAESLPLLIAALVLLTLGGLLVARRRAAQEDN